ncbi:MAG: inositol monophosphatase family protein [Anaerolineales bacterium]
MSDVNEFERWAEIAQEIAAEAGALLRQRYGTPHTIRQKGFRDIVTDVDLEVEALIVTRLRAALPQHAIITEEGEGDAAMAQAPVYWLIDPIDGTTNFSRHNPNFSISMAAMAAIAGKEDKRPVVGVIMEPLRDYCFTAYHGGGARLNGAPVRTSATTTLERAVFGSDIPRDSACREQHLALLNGLLVRARTVRVLGSAALGMAYVAAGWFDGYIHRHLHPWDQAAAALLVAEAGGVLATCSGAPWTVAAPDPLMAATPDLLAQIRAAQVEIEEGADV